MTNRRATLRAARTRRHRQLAPPASRTPGATRATVGVPASRPQPGPRPRVILRVRPGIEGQLRRALAHAQAACSATVDLQLVMAPGLEAPFSLSTPPSALNRGPRQRDLAALAQAAAAIEAALADGEPRSAP